MVFEMAEQMAAFYKVIGDTTRVRILYVLSEQELCVADIAKACGLSQSATSHQLAKLRDVRLVKAKRDGKEVYYSLDDDHVVQIFHLTLEHLRHQ